jgi:hypothetical protein
LIETTLAGKEVYDRVLDLRGDERALACGYDSFLLLTEAVRVNGKDNYRKVLEWWSPGAKSMR